MKTSIHRYLFVLACIAFPMGACAVLKKVAIVAGGAAAGATTGAVVGGPAGAGVGGAAGAVAAASISDVDEYKDGDSVSKKVLEEERDRREKDHLREIDRLQKVIQNRPVVEVEVSVPIVPRWVWHTFWASLAWLLWLKGHHVIAFIKTRNVANLLNIFMPSWLQDRLGTSKYRTKTQPGA